MRKIGLISCVKTKLPYKAEAKELYNSDFFKKMKLYVESRCDEWYILSAKYELLSPRDIISPYEKTLKGMPIDLRGKWAETVWGKLVCNLQSTDQVILLAGLDYREFLVDRIRNFGCEICIPMEGLKQGEQKRWLKENL